MAKRADLVPIDTIDVSPFDHWLQTEEINNAQKAIIADEAYLGVCALHDAADERRKALKEPFLRGCQHYDAQWRTARKTLERLRDHIGGLLSDYEYTLRQAAIVKAKKTTSKMPDKERAVALVKLAEQNAVSLPHGRWVDDPQIEVQDIRAVPEHLLRLDEAAVRRLCRAGTTDIPGLTITLRRKRSARV